MALPPPTWILDKLLIQNSFAVVYGPSGTGKTFLALDWAACIATGRAWWGHAVMHGGHVVYVAAEGAGGLGKRMRAWQVARRLSIDNLTVYSKAVNLKHASEVHQFLAQCPISHPALIIFDTLARCAVGADENSAKDMGIVVSNADLVRRQTGATVLFVHHTGKDRNGMRGSSAVYAACDTVLGLEMSDNIITLEVEKQKDSSNPDPWRLSMRVIPLPDIEDSSCVLNLAVNVLSEPAHKLTKAQRAIMDALASKALNPATFGELKADTGFSDQTVSRTLRTLIAWDYVDFGGAAAKSGNKRYTLTPYGVNVYDQLIAEMDHAVTALIQDQEDDQARINSLNPQIVGIPSDSLTLTPLKGRVSVSECETGVNTGLTHTNIDTKVSVSESQNIPLDPCRNCGATDWYYHTELRRWYCANCAH